MVFKHYIKWPNSCHVYISSDLGIQGIVAHPWLSFANTHYTGILFVVIC